VDSAVLEVGSYFRAESTKVRALFSDVVRQEPVVGWHSGRNGFDVNRRSGTNGDVTHQSTKNLLSLWRCNDKLLPKKAGANLILKSDKFLY
jgi:hypothetical protein